MATVTIKWDKSASPAAARLDDDSVGLPAWKAGMRNMRVRVGKNGEGTAFCANLHAATACVVDVVGGTAGQNLLIPNEALASAKNRVFEVADGGDVIAGPVTFAKPALGPPDLQNHIVRPGDTAIPMPLLPAGDRERIMDAVRAAIAGVSLVDTSDAARDEVVSYIDDTLRNDRSWCRINPALLVKVARAISSNGWIGMSIEPNGSGGCPPRVAVYGDCGVGVLALVRDGPDQRAGYTDSYHRVMGGKPEPAAAPTNPPSATQPPTAPAAVPTAHDSTPAKKPSPVATERQAKIRAQLAAALALPSPFDKRSTAPAV